MKKAIICHGVSIGFDSVRRNDLPSCSHHFLAWLQQRYIVAGVSCQNPSFPNSWIPDRNYHDDANVFSRLELDEDTRLVGHSCGAGFLLKYLAQHPKIKVRHLVLVAPWLDPEGCLGDYYRDFELDERLPQRVGRMELFYSTNDIESVSRSVERIIKTYPAMIVHNCGAMGHFTEGDMGGQEFLRLWEACRSEIGER